MLRGLLISATALVAGAGAAAADVTVASDGYFGVGFGTYDGEGIWETKTAPGDPQEYSDYVFVYDLDFEFLATGTSDSGLVFGASADIDDIGQGQSQGALGYEGEIFVSGDFGTLSMGDLDDAAEQVVGDLAGIGLTGLGDFNEMLYLLEGAPQPDGSPLALYTYAIEGLTLALAVDDDQGWSLGAGYAGDFWGVGLGYESIEAGSEVVVRDDGSDFFPSYDVVARSFIIDDNANQWIGQGTVTFSGITLKGAYGFTDVSGGGEMTQWGLSAEYEWNAWNFAGYYRQVDANFDDPLQQDGTDHFYGIGAGYDLGGGLALQGGLAQYELAGLKSDIVVADFGLSFNF